MDVSTEQFRRCDLVKAIGRVDSQTAPQLAKAFQELMDAGRHKFVFDMSDVDFISSAGLRVMIDVQKRCKRWNRGHMVLSGVRPQIHSAMDLVGFLPLFKIFDSTTEAVGYF